jgi:hypothetical protein
MPDYIPIMKKRNGITEPTINRDAFISLYLFDIPRSSVTLKVFMGKEIFRQNGCSTRDMRYALLSGQKPQSQDNKQNKVTLYTDHTRSADSLRGSA